MPKETGMNSIAFFEVFAWNLSSGRFDIWLGTATRDAIAKLGGKAQAGFLVGYESSAKFPDGWACKNRLTRH
jgi:hypothetical protein